MKKQSRKKNGYALITIIGIGAAAMLFLMAVADILVSILRSEAAEYQKSVLVNAIDSGFEYTVSQLNSSLSTGVPATIDVPAGETQIVFSLPTEYLADADSVRIKVRKLTSSEWGVMSAYTMIYRPDMNPFKTAATATYNDPITTSYSQDYLRVVEITAKKGVFSKSARSIIFPTNVGSLPNDAQGNPAPIPVGSVPQPLFEEPLLAKGNLNLRANNGALDIQSNGTSPINVQSNQAATIYPNTNLNGNLVVNNVQSGAPSTPVVSLEGDPSSSNVQGRVVANSNVDTDFSATSGPTPLSGDNVQATLEGSPRPAGSDSFNSPISSSANTSTSEGVYVPSDSSASPLTSLSVLNSSTSTNTQSFHTNYLTTDDPSNPGSQVDPVVLDTNSPVSKIYVDGNSADANAVKIDGTVLVNNGDPRNLQIYYDGTKPVEITVSSNKTFSATVYAPYSNVSISGTGNFKGALVGKNVDINLNGKMNLLDNLRDFSNSTNGNLNRSSGMYYLANSSTGKQQQNLKAYRSLTWQELSNTTLVP